MAEASRRILRAARLEDAVRIAEIYSQSIRARDSTMDTEPVGPSEIVSWMQKQGPREYLAVAETLNEVRGWGIVKRYHERTGYARAGETSVYIDRRHTGNGHGSALQVFLMDFCRRSGYHHLVAKIWADNAGSIRMHQRHGYRLVGIQKEIGFVDGQWRDVAILQAVLDAERPPATDTGR